ncbi:fructose-6-phosphate aldolase [uncultured Robinsoniella sp.]|uniref:fructose-6-phosphate aldolase n=1 Tax=uncultured Robinsoniella sp. TaxID=904190 RepID=UPI00374FA7C6
MELLFDTANLDEIKKYSQFYPITGVTSNPSILKAEGNVDLYGTLREIRNVIGMDKSLHVQVLAEDAVGMLKEAEAVLKNVDDKVFIKIPTTEEGLKAMMLLKARGIGVTATAIYTEIQGFMAIMAGADFIAPYCNRMENLDVDFEETIADFRQMIDENHSSCKILAASFKNIRQVNRAFTAGAHTATVQPMLMHSSFEMAAVKKAVDDFKADWVAVRGEVSLTDL